MCTSVRLVVYCVGVFRTSLAKNILDLKVNSKIVNANEQIAFCLEFETVCAGVKELLK